MQNCDTLYKWEYYFSAKTVVLEKILIGITSKNRASILPASVNSGLALNYTSKEVAVFDDNSTDDTNKLPSVFPQVTWHFSKEEKGYVFARNMFLQNTDAKYFCSLDDDSWFLDTEQINNAVQYMNEHENVAVLAFDILSPDRKVTTTENIISETNNFIGCGHMMRVSSVKKVGYYIPNPGYYGGEEKDLCIRLIDHGFSIMRFPALKIWHEKSSIARNIIKQHRSGVCNDFVFMWRRTPLLYLIPSIFAKLYVHLLYPIRYKNKSLYGALFSGIKDFIKFLFIGKINRKPVSIKGLHKYLSFNKK